MYAATKTRFGLFEEPELLPTGLISTAPDITPRFQLVMERIDYVLVEAATPLREDSLIPHIRSTTLTDLADLVDAYRRPTWALGPIKDWLASRVSATVMPAVEVSDDAQRLEAKLDDIQKWLGIGLDKAAAMAGIARGTVYAWRARGSSPRPATTSAVIRIHGLIAAAVNAIGVEPARSWFHSGEGSPLDEMLQAEGNQVRLAAVSTRLRRELLRTPAPPPNRALAITIDDITE